MTSFLKNAVWISVLIGLSFTPPTPVADRKINTPILTTEGLEDIIVETYYVSDTSDATDTIGGHLAPGSVTYRIYVDMAPGYKLKTVYGYPEHPLYINTTTTFFNNTMYGQSSGSSINNTHLNKNTTALDSWITAGAACKLNMGVLKSIDSNGSFVGGNNNDGGSAGIPDGLLKNTAADIPLTTADGLMSSSFTPQLSLTSVDLSPFEANNNGHFSIEAGMWGNDEGVQGPTLENQVLIAQITTTGHLSFQLNVLIQSPTGEIEYYAAFNPIQEEVQFSKLTRP